MSHAFALRSSSSGPQFDGNADDVLTMQADGRCKFLPPSGGGGAIVPLTLEFWVDQGRAGSTQDGSIANPFLTIQNGIDAIAASLAGAGSLVVAQGDYSAEELTCPLDISIVASTAPITVAKLGLEDAPVPALRLLNVNVTGESWLIGGFRQTVIEGGGLRGDVHMTGETILVGLDAEFGDVTCPDSLSTMEFRGCHVLSIDGEESNVAGTVNAWDTTIDGGARAENVNLHVCTVNGLLDAFRASLEQSTVQEAVTGNTLTADTFSLRALRVGSASSAPGLLMVVSDHPTTQAVVTVPALEGGMDEVTINGAGLFLKEGDTVDVSLATSGPVPRLDNIGIAATWVESNGDLTVRFFGSTAGGAQLLDLNLNQNSP